MDLTVHPFRGVGEIDFGANPEKVRKVMGAGFRSFKRTPDSAFPTDYYDRDGVFFYYDASGHLEAVEFSSPSVPIVDGLKLLAQPFSSAVSSLSAKDDKVELSVDGALSRKLGISIWSPLAKDDPSAPVESVLAFKTGYYD